MKVLVTGTPQDSMIPIYDEGGDRACHPTPYEPGGMMKYFLFRSSINLFSSCITLSRVQGLNFFYKSYRIRDEQERG